MNLTKKQMRVLGREIGKWFYTGRNVGMEYGKWPDAHPDNPDKLFRQTPFLLDAWQKEAEKAWKKVVKA